MKYIFVKILTITLICLGAFFLYGIFTGNFIVESYSKLSFVLIFVLFYFVKSRRKDLFFGGFLSFFALAEISKLYFVSDESLKYITNIFFIAAYLLLIFYAQSNVHIIKLIKQFKKQSLILFLLNIYIVFTLESIIFSEDNQSFFSLTYLLENLYNVVVLWLMSLSFLNFLYKDNRRSFLFFALCISFGLSEIVQVPYIHLSPKPSLRIAYSLLGFIGYLFIYFYITSRYNRRFKLLS